MRQRKVAGDLASGGHSGALIPSPNSYRLYKWSYRFGDWKWQPRLRLRPAPYHSAAASLYAVNVSDLDICGIAWYRDTHSGMELLCRVMRSPGARFREPCHARVRQSLAVNGWSGRQRAVTLSPSTMISTRQGGAQYDRRAPGTDRLQEIPAWSAQPPFYDPDSEMPDVRQDLAGQG